MLSIVGARSRIGHPDGLDAQAHADVLDRNLLQQVEDRDVGAIEQHGRCGERRLHGHPREGNVHDAERRDDAPVRDLDLIGGGDAAGRARSARRNVDLRALRTALADDALLLDVREEARERCARREGVVEADGARDDAVGFRHQATSWLEAGDVGDVADEFGSPSGRGRACRYASRLATGVDHVQHRRVRAVELHERERELALERVLRTRLGHPRPRRDDACLADLDHVRQLVAGLGIVLLRRDEDAAVARADAENAALLQAREEAADDLAGAAGVGIFEDVGGSQGVGHESANPNHSVEEFLPCG